MTEDQSSDRLELRLGVPAGHAISWSAMRAAIHDFLFGFFHPFQTTGSTPHKIGQYLCIGVFVPAWIWLLTAVVWPGLVAHSPPFDLFTVCLALGSTVPVMLVLLRRHRAAMIVGALLLIAIGAYVYIAGLLNIYA